MTLLSAVSGFAVVAALLTIIPGVDSTLVLRGAISRSRRYALMTTLGIISGVFIWGLAAAAGVSAVLAASRTAYLALTWGGALYLVILGAGMLARTLRARRRRTGPEASAGSVSSAPEVPAGPSAVLPSAVGPAPEASVARGLQRRRLRSGAQAFGTGLLTNLMNPKVGVFYMATIPQFLPAGVSPLLMGALLAGVHCLLTFVWCGGLALAAGAFRQVLSRPQVAAWIERLAGTALIGFGVSVALATTR